MPQAPSPSGRQLFNEICAGCHGNTAVERAPSPDVLRAMSPERVYAALTTGSMRVHVAALTDPAVRSVAEYLGERRLRAAGTNTPAAGANACGAGAGREWVSAHEWNGWGGVTNTRFQTAAAAAISAGDVSRIKPKWAFGVAEATAVYGQPTIVGGRVFVSADTGAVYALDAATGCTYWSFDARAGVRTAPFVATLTGDAAATVFFGDLKGQVYAVNATTGALRWQIQADAHSLTRIIAAPAFHSGVLFVPVASAEEGASTNPAYPCCTFRGSVLALDAATGRTIWRTYTVPDAPRRTDVGAGAPPRWGPSGGGVWSTPTVDARRNALYVGTGNAYSRPVAATTDAVMALDLSSGRVLWSVQALADDAWVAGCGAGPRSANCPDPLGPDYDFGASPMLTTRADGRQLLVTAQKSGVVWAHDPDRRGALVWRASLAGNAPAADGEIVWGGAADSERAYFGLNSGGLAAVELGSGRKAWSIALGAQAGRRAGHTAATSVIPGVVFSGGWDGILRAFASESGRVLWEHDTLRAYDTVNGVPARGGSMGAAGPTIAGGMLFVGSGYIGVRGGTPGNVLLAFMAE